MTTRQPSSSVHFISRMKRHSEELRCLAAAIEQSIKEFGADKLASALAKEKATVN